MAEFDSVEQINIDTYHRFKHGFFPSNALENIMDFCSFLLTSLGHILAAFYYTVIGYPEKSLSGELALITGGGGGLGRLLALRLVGLGCKVVLWDISKDSIDETCAIIESLGGICKGYVVDIANRQEVFDAANVVKMEFGEVTLLFNNAGVVSGRMLLETPDVMIERCFNVNIISHFWTVKAFLPSMLENNHGHIITVASMAGHVGMHKLVDYCASKFAAVGFDESLRLELEILGCNNVHTTVICPYFIQSTGMFDDVHSRWIPTLNSNTVADAIVKGVRRNQKYVIIPQFFRLLLIAKWIFPWPCNSGFLRRLVLDAAPEHQLSSELLKKTVLKTGEAKLKNSSTNNGLLIDRKTSPEKRVL